MRFWATRAGLALAAVLPLGLVYSRRIDDIEVYYGWHRAFWAGGVPYRDFPVEYPPLALVPALTPGPWVHGLPRYAAAFMVGMWLWDLALKWTLYRACSPRRRALAVCVYAALSACLYFTYLKRLDLAVTALTLAAVVRLQARPASRAGWALWGAAVATKLYPALLGPALLAWCLRRGVGLRRLAVQLTAGGAAILTPLALAYAAAGPTSLAFLAYHRDRGLHIASCWTAAALALAGLGTRIELNFSFGALHVAAPWAARMARVADWAVPLAALATAAAMARPQRTPAGPQVLARACLAVLVAVLATAKVFSPQFVSWLLPLGVLAAMASPRPDWALIASLAAIAGLTAQTFPGEGGLGAGIAYRQAALIGRSGLIWTLWAYLLATPSGLAAATAAVGPAGRPRVADRARAAAA